MIAFYPMPPASSDENSSRAARASGESIVTTLEGNPIFSTRRLIDSTDVSDEPITLETLGPVALFVSMIALWILC